MGFLKWMQEKGALGGIARSAANAFRNSVKSNPNEDLTTHLANVAVLRYLSVGQPRKAKLILQRVYEYGLESPYGLGLRDVCFEIAKLEMDIVGIEESTMEVIISVLEKEKLGRNVIFGKVRPEFSAHFLELLDIGE